MTPAAQPDARAARRSAAATPPRELMSRFNVAFSLMSLIPLLTCAYLITVRFFSFSILLSLNGVYFLLALAIALLGLLAGHELIRDIIRRLVEANTALAQLTNRQAAFVGNVAHEFRSPLTAFKVALENLQDGLDGPVTADQHETLGICQKEVNRLTRLVADLLDLTQIEAGRLPLARKPVVLQEALRAVEKLFGGLLRDRGLTLTMEMPSEPAVVTGDSDRLQQVLINLVGNASKFTKRGGIRLRLTRAAGDHQIEVIDTGPGIADEDLERIFDKFERVGEGGGTGSGLGLPIARDIVELHGGRLWAESGGPGSRFIVRLPAASGAPTTGGTSS
jgi:signal transduction histidine kinase